MSKLYKKLLKSKIFDVHYLSQRVCLFCVATQVTAVFVFIFVILYDKHSNSSNAGSNLSI